jgi:hypothetical protein
MKVGDIIICKKPCYMSHNDERATTINKSYKIDSIDDYDTLFITDDIDQCHGFYYLDSNNESYYGKWFYTQKELRNLKLKKLNESRE